MISTFTVVFDANVLYGQRIRSLSCISPSAGLSVRGGQLTSIAIVTFNERDFPTDELAKYGLHTKHPDAFIRDVDGIDPGVVAEAAKADRLHYPLTIDDYIEGIKTSGLPMVAWHLDKVRVLLEE
jgi:hypothetical protein